ncbi:MAG TPA: DEAD/DEAH box helicase family protein [Candidatus Corynebacterium avicola]|uniref:DEAD/DEAH box helicase family protein n=1 Tax=Candidatus Corynebacterium avicola TaxID=2838527 RepID=A0A9D1RSH8_9CORY|nr:DEAD/DEAH box helicase family protein [Candidatus Corynebacterium avicola]
MTQPHSKPLDLVHDEGLVNAVTTQFDLRTPNGAALDATVARIAGGEFDPQNPLVLNLATGVGKTYVMGALIEYLRQCGHYNVMVVTPGLVIQSKTVANFARSNRKYIGGFDVPPRVYTPDNTREATKNRAQETLPDSFTGSDVFVFNVQNLLAPKKTDQNTLGTTMEARRAKVRRFSETDGNVYEHLQSLDDLVIIADESHLYGSDAKAFNAALRELDPSVTIGLTASAEPGDDIVFRYPLYQAITDRYVKRPVIVCRSTDYSEYADAEERQLRDGLAVLRAKAAEYLTYSRNNPAVTPVRPVMLVTCSDIDHATSVASLLASPGYVGDPSRVLQVDSRHDDETTRWRLDTIDTPDSTVEAVVSVGKLREGWDARNVAVIVSLRAMASEVLTQQTMGRGLRLPFKTYTGVDTIDQLDIIAHKSYVNFLQSEDALEVFGIEKATTAASDPAGDHTESGAVEVEVPVAPGSGETVQVPFVDATGAAQSTTGGGDTPGEPPVVGSQPDHPHSVVGVAELGDDETIPEPVDVPDPVVVEINEKFVGETFLFPSSTMGTHVDPFSLSAVTDDQVHAAMAKVSVEGVSLERRKVETTDGEIRLARTTSATGGTDVVADDLVTRTLAHEAVGTRTFALTESNKRILQARIIDPFLGAVGREPWTEKALASARNELRVLLKSAKKNFVESNARLVPEITPVTLPVRSSYTLPVGAEFLPVVKPDDLAGAFSRNGHYGPWADNSLFNAAQFDSLSAEYTLAYMLDVDPDVRWWKRLYPDDKARFAWSGGDRFYNPDFVVRDTEGNYWIIEAKATSKIDGAEVQEKRRVAEAVMREITGDSRFPQQWGYILASETDIEAVTSWQGLLGRTNPVIS